MDYVLSLLVLGALGIIVIKDAQPTEKAESFMSMSFTKGLKGIACILIVLAHIPEMYSNIITKIILHFGYSYVTVFFMVSAYGCRYAVANNKSYFQGFWRKRLKALLVPAIIINLIDFFLAFWVKGEIQYSRVFLVNYYIDAILFAYFIFWSVWRIKAIPLKYKDIMVTVLIIGASLMTMYTPAKVFFLWPVESIGFVWGLLIFHYKDEIKNLFLKYRIKMSVVLGSISFVLGILYVRFKTIAFFGEYLLKGVLGVVLLGFFLSMCYRLSFRGKWITWLGNISYEVYLFHIVVINTLKELLPECRGGIFIIIVMVITLAGASVIHRFAQCVSKRISKV